MMRPVRKPAVKKYEKYCNKFTFKSRWTTLFLCKNETPSKICFISRFTSFSLKASSPSATHWSKISPPAALQNSMNVIISNTKLEHPFYYTSTEKISRWYHPMVIFSVIKHFASSNGLGRLPCQYDSFQKKQRLIFHDLSKVDSTETVETILEMLLTVLKRWMPHLFKGSAYQRCVFCYFY